MIVSLNNISKSFHDEYLFEGISFNINKEDRIALIGDNGVGKSTLIKIINKDLSQTSGDVNYSSKSTIGYLSQSVFADTNNTLIEELRLVFSESIKLEDKLHNLSVSLEDDPLNVELNKLYEETDDKFQHLGGYDYHYQIDYILSNFKFNEEMKDRKISSFSGGEKTRASFAKLLLSKPNLLLLDEPTNHLDIETIEWLESYLKEYNGALLLISHDTYFIDNTCNKIYEIENKKITKYTGNFEFYKKTKIENLERLKREYSKQQKQIAHLQSFVDRFRYKESKAKLAQDRIKKIAKIQLVENPSLKKTINIKFDDYSFYSSDSIIKLSNVSVGYNKPLLKNLDLEIFNNEKLLILGPNGQGKTTLLNAIKDNSNLLSGDIVFNKNIKLAYFEQTQAEFDSNETLKEYLHNKYKEHGDGVIKGYLNMFLFDTESIMKKVSMLSGGEKVRLALLIIMLSKPNVLLLDEPTNHLDLTTKNIIIDVIKEFKGTVIAVSHDRLLIDSISNRMIYIENGELAEYQCNYSELKLIKQEIKKEQQKKSESSKTKKTKSINFNKLEEQISNIEEELKKLEESKFDFEVYTSKTKITEVDNTIEKLNEELLSLYEKLD